MRGLCPLDHSLSANAMHKRAEDIPVAGVLWYVLPALPIAFEFGRMDKLVLMAGASQCAVFNTPFGMSCQASNHWPTLSPIATLAEVGFQDVFSCLKAHGGAILDARHCKC